MIYYFVIGWLGFLSYLDLRSMTVPNRYLVPLLTMVLFLGNLGSRAFLMALVGICAVLIWAYGAWGGADAKIVTLLAGLLPLSGLGNGYALLLLLIGITIIFACAYLAASKLFLKEHTHVPFIPILTIAYTITYLYRF